MMPLLGGCRRRSLPRLLLLVVLDIPLGGAAAAAAAAAFAGSMSRDPSTSTSNPSGQFRAGCRRDPSGPVVLETSTSTSTSPWLASTTLAADESSPPSPFELDPAQPFGQVTSRCQVPPLREAAATKRVFTNRRTRRRTFLGQASRRMGLAALLASAGGTAAPSARADDRGTINSSTSSAARYVYRDAEQGFQFAPPEGFSQTAKPLPTHLKEVQFAPAGESGTLPKSYQYGITVDPVRIDSLREFGTPQEVAAKVVSAELNRDGVFVVTLMTDPVEQDEHGVLGYVLNYKSQGKRGDKRFVCKFFIAQNRLYALTSQCTEDDYDTFKDDMDSAVRSFAVLRPT